MPIVYRDVKGSALSYSELDGNFADLAARTALSWSQIGGEPHVEEGTANAPSLETFRGGIDAWAYANGQMSQSFITFDVPFDYAVGTDLVVGIHWSPGSNANTGNVRFGLEFTYAWSYGPGVNNVFGPTSTIYMNASQADGTPYTSYLNFNDPADNFPAALVQPNMRFLVRLFRDGGNVADTFAAPIFIIGTDFFYQVDKFGTSTKVPPFV
jgi:hypothetical protein